jgi:hypothetical protein
MFIHQVVYFNDTDKRTFIKGNIKLGNLNRGIAKSLMTVLIGILFNSAWELNHQQDIKFCESIKF